MTKKLYFIVLLILLQFSYAIVSFAQYENVWILGSGVGLDFSNGTPTFFSNSIALKGDEANASVCDANGNFLFFTEGNIIFDRNYDTMLNSYPLVGPNQMVRSNLFNPTSSTTQGALIVPMPDSPAKYYIFSLGYNNNSPMPGNNAYTGRLYYSVVDMDLNNALGGVDPNRKGILLDSNLQEKMTSVVGDRCNIWVLTCDRDGYFRAYEITSSGINTRPVISSVSMGKHTNGQGSIAISPNRKKIAALNGMGASIQPSDTLITDLRAAVALFDFDPASGSISNPVTLFPHEPFMNLNGILRGPASGEYSVVFSPDNSKLYVSNFSMRLYQFDLSSGDSTIMSNSRTLLGTQQFSQLKLAPDGKIYFRLGASALGSIDAPNMAGAACQYNNNNVSLILPTPTAPTGFPNVISVFKRDTTYSSDSIANCKAEEVLISATDTSGFDYIWNDGMDGANRSVSTSGTYWLQYYTAPCVFHTDTFKVTLVNLPTPTIKVDEFDLSTTLAYDTYQWYLNGNIIEGATGRVYTVTENGDYTVVVSDNENGCIDTSAIYKVTNVPVGIENTSSLQQEIKIYPNPGNDILHIAAPIPVEVTLAGIDGRLIKEKISNEAIDIRSLAEGVYLIRVYSLEGVLLKVEKVIKVK